MKVLVTGANGFIGRHVVSRFRELGVEVHAMTRQDADLLHGAARRSFVQQVKATHLVHLAWTTAHGSYWHDPANQAWVRASLDLLREFADAGGQHAVLAGTCAEDDWSGQGGLAHTSYGRCKAALRILGSDLAEQLKLPLAWGRIYFPFGPGEQAQRLVPSIATKLLAGEPAATGAPDLERDFVYVEDLAAMFALLSQRGHAGCVDLCSGEAVSIGSVVRQIAALTGGAELLRLGVLPARAGDPKRLVGHAGPLRSLGWTGGLGLSEGLRRTVETLRP